MLIRCRPWLCSCSGGRKLSRVRHTTHDFVNFSNPFPPQRLLSSPALSVLRLLSLPSLCTIPLLFLLLHFSSLIHHWEVSMASVVLLSLLIMLQLHVGCVLADDVSALLKLKQLLGNSGALASWVDGGNPCPSERRRKWTGVICSNDTKSRVTGLQLENMGLMGLIDVDALLGLDKLRTLSVCGNIFGGPMPNISKLGALRAIYLSRNNFSGVIPSNAFDHMWSLKKVVLSSNQFAGPIPASLVRVPKLVELRLDNNRFTGELPDLQQPNLTVVNFSHNDLGGAVPGSLSKFDAGSYAGT